MNTYQLKIQLYEDYVKEIEEIINVPIGADIDAVDEWCEWYINSEEHKWMNISDENNNICGFLIIREDKENRSPVKSYNIVDAYITKENRNKGYMTKRFVNYAKKHPGIYSFTGYTKNNKGNDFWIHLFAKEFKISLQSIEITSEFCDVELKKFSTYTGNKI